jgi:hypothetical protein
MQKANNPIVMLLKFNIQLHFPVLNNSKKLAAVSCLPGNLRGDFNLRSSLIRGQIQCAS